MIFSLLFLQINLYKHIMVIMVRASLEYTWMSPNYNHSFHVIIA